MSNKYLSLLRLFILAPMLMGAIKTPCLILIKDTLSLEQTAALHIGSYLQRDRKVPSVKNLFVMNNLKDGMPMDETAWATVNEIALREGSPKLEFYRGRSGDYLRDLGEVVEKDLGADTKNTLVNLGKLYTAAREKAKSMLNAQEEKTLLEKNRFLTPEEIRVLLEEYTNSDRTDLKDLGYIPSVVGRSTRNEWRYQFLLSHEDVVNKLKKKLQKEFTSFATNRREIPETDAAFYSELAKRLGVSAEEAEQFFGKAGIYESTQDLIKAAKGSKPDDFAQVIDKRV